MDTAPDASPAWSPDSQWIAFTSWREGGAPEIYRMRADGSEALRLTNNNTRDDYPVWSPNGKNIAYISGEIGSENVIVMSADGRYASQLSTAPGNNSSPSWSPDNQYLAFQTNRNNGRNEIFIMNLNSEIIKQISLPGQDASEPVWKAQINLETFTENLPTPVPTQTPVLPSTPIPSFGEQIAGSAVTLIGILVAAAATIIAAIIGSKTKEREKAKEEEEKRKQAEIEQKKTARREKAKRERKEREERKQAGEKVEEPKQDVMDPSKAIKATSDENPRKNNKAIEKK